MTDTGLRVLRLMNDGNARRVPTIAKGIGKCQRVTRATVLGCIVSGLIEQVAGSPGLFQITDAGRDALP